MPSERIQRRIDALLDEADAAVAREDWVVVGARARAALVADPENADAAEYLAMAERGLGEQREPPTNPQPAAAATTATTQPTSFVDGRYHVRKFLGEGGKKRVFLAHDQSLDRDVAFALIKTEGLDATGRERIVREAQAMGRLGAHPHVVTIFEIGPSTGSGQADSPYIVTELMGGGDVEGLLTQADGALPLARTLEIAKDVARGLVFAHEKGVVHRDLKPGNVWLTDTGVAKIGDFGLAVSLDRSRLTQHGMMVGTVAYMPPEQALGGEVTPQADLYSLGAMLYEMVTGKLPFQAEDPTAVISQHINTPPVAPSWNSPHCPPDLERLILQLLAKVPADRPASAREVLAALERVDPNALSASHSDSQANPLDRLARGVFVGRERELERLRSAFDEAFAGRGSVVMLVGEPGIGKTRTVQEVETYARMRGAQVYWGRANESGGAPPFWPWLLVGRAYRAQNADEVRRKEWGPYSTELQRIFPLLRDLFPNLPPPPPLDSEEGQFQLFDAMSGFVRGVSERVPLVVALDDLHWADRATLQLLAHLARDLAHARILVLGTYRDTDLDRRHPLSQALAEMNREDLFLRLPLRGLGEREVGAYIARAAGVEPSRELVRRVFEETEGNPFFLSEVVNLMAQEGTLGASASDVAIPEGVRQALGRRLDRLSSEANSLLTTLAVAGREFDHALVRALSGHDEQTTLQLVEEALAARVLEESGRTGEYRFKHALMQETLLTELSAARRVLLHGQIAEAFETLYGTDDRDHLAALANHYAESAVLNREHARNAVRYLRLAAEQSMAALGYDDAVKLFERCLGVIEQSHDAYGEDPAPMWAALALCRNAVGEVVTGRAALERALALFAECGDARTAARAWADFMAGASPGRLSRERTPLDALVTALGDEDSVELCRLLAMRGLAELGPEGDTGAARAEAMALRLGLTGAAAPFQLTLRAWNKLTQQGAFREAAALMDAMQVEPGSTGAFLRTMLGSAALAYAGDVEGWLARSSELVALARTYRRRGPEARGVADLASVAWRRGEWAQAEQQLAAVDVNAHIQALPVPAAMALADGETATALRLLPGDDHPAAIGWPLLQAAALRVQVLLLAGDGEAARAALGPLLAGWDREYSTERLVLLGYADVAIAALAEEPHARALAAYLEHVPKLRCYPGPAGGLGNPDVLRGALALRFGDLDAAEQHFCTGLEWASMPDVRFVVDQGRCLQGRAEVAERRGDLEAARTHLDAAGALFAAHGGARLYLDQVLAKKQILKA